VHFDGLLLAGEGRRVVGKLMKEANRGIAGIGCGGGLLRERGRKWEWE
jgi:hypothetical protein